MPNCLDSLYLSMIKHISSKSFCSISIWTKKSLELNNFSFLLSTLLFSSWSNWKEENIRQKQNCIHDQEFCWVVVVVAVVVEIIVPVAVLVVTIVVTAVVLCCCCLRFCRFAFIFAVVNFPGVDVVAVIQGVVVFCCYCCCRSCYYCHCCWCSCFMPL